MLFFTIFVFIALAIQIGIIIYAWHVLTKPLHQLTEMMQRVEEIEPEKFLPTLLNQPMPRSASSEVNRFYKVYQKLLQNIHVHELHEKEMAVQASIGKIASHIAHDIRSPLSVLGGFMGLVKDIDDPDFNEFKGAAGRSVDKLGRMADDLVDYASAKQIQPAPVNIGKILNEAAEEFAKTAAEREISMEVNCQDSLAARIDEHKFNRVLANMIQNAVHAIPQTGGRIGIRARLDEKGWLRISIADTGSGIEEKHLPRLFDSSFTFGKPSGTGLSLSYCKNVVEAHGGRISVESKAGKGSTFTIELPISASRLAEVGQPEGKFELPAARAQDSARAILVVDDDEQILAQWKHLIGELTQFDIVTASGPEEMLKIYPTPERFRAAICDYRFEGKDTTGIDIIKILKEKGICCRYLCTGFYYDPALREAAIAAGAHAIIPKPIPDGLVKQLFG
ncbi:MAG: hybrid sensor histidine kinase/response regulator [Pseudomonadota bacterium]